MNIQEIIFSRISIRAYQPESASLEELEAVRRVGEMAEALTPTKMQFHLCDDAQMGKDVRILECF